MSKPVIKIGNMTVPQGLSKDDLLKFLVENKAILMAEKKAAIKHADVMSVGSEITKLFTVDKDGKIVKADSAADGSAPASTDTVMVVINTTNWMDSHSDVHIPGIWKKSLKDNPYQLHLQEHVMAFANVISDKSKGYTQTVSWKDLGFNLEGQTEALIFSTGFTGRNPYMEDMYRKGYVTNHSVGMRYVSLKLCVNKPDDEYYKEEYANWQTYSPMVVNIDDAEAQGYFWAVTEAKCIEGSAVVKGSNILTPTIGFKSAEPTIVTQKDAQPAAATGTQIEIKNESSIRWEKVAEAFSK